MANATLRRHLGALLDCGIILRRDSPNGKRYARKGRGGELEDAFGFSLAPLLARAEEFRAAAERVRADNRALRLMRERITLQRRDIGKLIEAAVEEGAPGNWVGLEGEIDKIAKLAEFDDLLHSELNLFSTPAINQPPQLNVAATCRLAAEAEIDVEQGVDASVDLHASRSWLVDAVKDLQEGGFPRPIDTHEPQSIAWLK